MPDKPLCSIPDCGKASIVFNRQLCNKHYKKLWRSGEFVSTKPVIPDITGEVFGEITVVSRVETSKPGAHYQCTCSCGTRRIILASNLIKGNYQSCGCKKVTLISRKSRTHGMTESREYRSWSSMKSRCENPKDTSYSHYGGRGIGICSRWLDSFEDFYADMGPRPDGMSLDRIDVNGGYQPDNCRWADAKSQSSNRRNASAVLSTWRKCILDRKQERHNHDECLRMVGLVSY